MYQPRRLSGAPASRPESEAIAFRAPRRAVPSRAHVLRTRVAPTALAVAVLATSGAFALGQGATGSTLPEASRSSDPAVAAAYRAEDATSRDAERAPLGDEASTTPEAAGLADASPADAATEAAPTASVAGSWRSALGTVTGDQFAQSSVAVRAQADGGAVQLGTLAKGDKVAVTDLTAAGFRQVSYQGKVGYVAADQLGDRAPVEQAPAPAASSAPASSTFFWPTAGSISSPWGMRLHPILRYTRLHGGVDIGGASGAPVYAAQDGVITKAATGYNSGSGNNIRIDHGTQGGKKLESAYLHLSSLKVKVGQRVKRGQLIGAVGSTGLSTAPHLHFSVYVQGVNSNPARYLGR